MTLSNHSANGRNTLLSSEPGVPDPSTSKRPCLISSAAAIAEAHITRAKALPTLTRRTPRSGELCGAEAGAHHDDVERLGRYGSHHLGDSGGVPNARREQA